MVEAEIKKQQNIIEYVLYMFHTEDLLRSHNLNHNHISEYLVDKSDRSYKEKVELKKWYLETIEAMESENIQNTGHLSDVLEVLGELSYLHTSLMNVFQDRTYIELWEKAYPNIVDLANKTNGQTQNPIELCFNGIYGVLVLRMKKQEVSKETLSAVETFSNLLRHLGKKYQDIREGRLRFPSSMNN